MGCTDNWGRSKEEITRDELNKDRGYWSGGLGKPDQCRRCGSMVHWDAWLEHDEFHFRVNADYEWKNNFGVFSEYIKRKYPKKFAERWEKYKKL